MAESLRLAVQKQICEFISNEVRPANGYKNSLENAVLRGRMWMGRDDPLPMVSMLEALNPDRDPSRVGWEQTLQREGWVLLLQGWVQDDRVNPTDPAHNLMAEVKQALAKLAKSVAAGHAVRGTPLECVDAILIEPGTVRPPDELSEKAYFWLRITVRLIEDLDNPMWPLA